MARTVIDAGTGYFPTVEGSSLKPWRVEKVITVQHTLTLMNSYIKMIKFGHLIARTFYALKKYLENTNHSNRFDVAGKGRKKCCKYICLAACSAV